MLGVRLPDHYGDIPCFRVENLNASATREAQPIRVERDGFDAKLACHDARISLHVRRPENQPRHYCTSYQQ